MNYVLSASKTSVFIKEKVHITLIKTRHARLFFATLVSMMIYVPNSKMPDYLKNTLQGQKTSEEHFVIMIFMYLIDDHDIAFLINHQRV